MTKYFLYVKIYSMMRNIFVRKKVLYILIVFLALTAVMFSYSVKGAFADENQENFGSSQFLPTKNLEVFEFSGSEIVYINQDTYALVNQVNNTSSLWIYKNGEWNKYESSLPAIQSSSYGQVRYLAQDKFVVSNDTNLYLYNLADDTLTPLTWNSATLSASFFDVSGNYLIRKSSGGSVFPYQINANGKVTLNYPQLEISAKEDSYVAVNEQGVVYYIGTDGYLHQSDVNEPICNVTGISTMVTRGDFLFFVAGSDIYKLNCLDYSLEKLNKPQSSFDLGNLVAPASVSFKEENLLICDPQTGAVQEFALDGNNLVWTGFAIAKNKTAFNRITDSATDIERYGDLTAVINDQKITVINETADFDAYNQDYFLNISKQELGGSMPDGFALGKTTLGLFKNVTNENLSSVSFILYNVNAHESEALINEFTLPSPANLAYDVCYQNGFYYVLSRPTGNELIIQKINETNGEVTQFKTLEPMTNPVFTVNVYGVPFVFDESSQIIKLSSDLKGNVFALKTDGKIYRFDYDRATATISQTPSELPSPNGQKIESFAMSFDKSEAYYICNEQEFIYKTNSLGNIAIDSIEKNSSLILSGTSATPNDLLFFDSLLIESHSYYNDNVNSYAVSVDGQGFAFDSLVTPLQKEDGTWENRYYTVVCYIENPGIYVLSGQNQIILADVAPQDLKSPDYQQLETNSFVFVTTDVHAYYLPIITKDGTYILKDFARLEKGTEVSVIKSFSFIDRHYYVAKFNLSEQIIYGYIPVEFTTEILSEDRVFESFTIATATGVNVYSEQALTNVIFTLNDGDQIRVFAKENGVAKIGYFYQDSWRVGYVSAQVIVEQSNNTIRNVLVLLALTACVCGTVTFFVLRKRER